MEKRFASYVWIPALVVWTLLVQPIWNLNVETIATSQGLNDELDDAAKGVASSKMPEWFWDGVAFLTGDFLWGAVTVGSVYFAVDFVAWMRRRKSAVIKERRGLQVLSSIYTDASNLEKLLKNGTSSGYAVGHRSVTTAIPIGASSRVRSFFAQLDDFEIPVPYISKEMTVKDALMVLDFLALAMPFIGKSQVAQLRAEAKEFIAKLD